MKDGKCAKCGSSEVKSIVGAAGLSLSTVSHVWLRTYVCGECGYTENYVEPDDRKKVLAKAEPV